MRGFVWSLCAGWMLSAAVCSGVRRVLLAVCDGGGERPEKWLGVDEVGVGE